VGVFSSILFVVGVSNEALPYRIVRSGRGPPAGDVELLVICILRCASRREQWLTTTRQ